MPQSDPDSSVRTLDTPLGPMVAEADGVGVRSLQFVCGRTDVRNRPEAGDAALRLLTAELRRYFAGELERFSTPLAPRGAAFQQRVWDALLTIPHGETRSYECIALGLNNPGGQRAVGAANAANPIAIVIPCHRVVRKGGGLGGYAGGLHRKRALLELEGAHVVDSLFTGRSSSWLTSV